MDQTIKGVFNPHPLSVDANTLLYDCIKTMREQRISCLIVTEHNKPVGIYTEADIIRTLCRELDTHTLTIRELMSSPLITASESLSLFEATYLLTTNHIRHLPAVNAQNELVGVITQTDIINHFGEEHFMGVRSVNSVMTHKILTVKPGMSVQKVVEMMGSYISDCAIAVEDEQPIGILTERDMAAMIVAEQDLHNITMGEVMTSPVLTIQQHSTTFEAVKVMNQKKVRRLVVVDQYNLICGTLVQEDIIRNLENNYIDFLKNILIENSDSLQKSQAAFQEKAAHLESLLHSSLGLAIIATDDKFNTTYLNDDAQAVFGCHKGSCINKPVDQIIKCSNFHEHSLHGVKAAIEKEGEYSFNHAHFFDQNQRHFETRINPIIDDHKTVGYTLVSRDITDILRTERRLRLASHVFESAIEGIMVTDADGTIQSVNPAFSEITGYSPQEAIGNNPRMLHSDRHSKEFYNEMWNRLITVGRWQGEVWNRRKNGEIYPERLSISSVRDEQGNISQFTAVFYDITDIKEQEEKINHRAYHDPLTELPNRLLFKDRLGQAITRARRSGTHLAVMFIDIDHFKRLNDTLGHQAGDEFLQIISILFRSALREQDTVSRFAGDEFTVLLDDNINCESALVVANKLLNLFKQPFQIQGQDAYLGASIGIACYPEDGNNPEILIKNADTAMYHAKENGRSNIQLFHAEMETQVKQRVTLESELRKALGNNELTIHYQPIIDLHSKTISSMEALLRWNNGHGNIPPTQFIPIAEESGLIVPIGEWVLRQTCRQMSQWQIDDVTGVAVSINLSARQFRERDLLTMIQRILEETQLNPKQLNLEITETSMMHDMNSSIETLNCLKELGVRILMDDFGTGYSSLTCLQKFPVDVLKLDHTFISEIEVDPDAARLASGIIAMAKDLRLEIIAEGVETKGQLRFLEQHGCDKVQGYLFHKPLTEEELRKVLKAERKNGASH